MSPETDFETVSRETSKLRIPPSKTVEWPTPQWLFDLLDKEFHFTVDAAASAANAKCERYWTAMDNGLAQNWTGERLFINPPFGTRQIHRFAYKAFTSSCIAVMVVPVKSDQGWWHDYALRSEIRYVKGRVTFEGATSGFNLPIAVLVFGTGRAGSYSLATDQTTILEDLGGP